MSSSEAKERLAMRIFALKKTRALFVMVVAGAGLVAAGSTASAASVSVDLCAVPGSAAPLPTSAPAVTVPIWGFGIPNTPGDCATATANLPGPQLVVNEGDSVTIDVTNALPAGHTLSFEIPGISFTAGGTDAAVGATVTRTFTASAPGIYLYQSSGDAGRQEAMGLAGALIVRSGTANRAYDSATTAY